MHHWLWLIVRPRTSTLLRFFFYGLFMIVRCWTIIFRTNSILQVCYIFLNIFKHHFLCFVFLIILFVIFTHFYYLLVFLWIFGWMMIEVIFIYRYDAWLVISGWWVWRILIITAINLIRNPLYLFFITKKFIWTHFLDLTNIL